MKGLLHHIEIYVSNLERTKLFWSWFLVEELGYTEFQTWKEGISYKLDQTYLVFVQTETKHLSKVYHRKNSGLNHLAFHADSQEMVNQLVLKLKKKGYTILYPDQYPYAGGKNHYAVFFEDPDRIKVELVAPHS